MSASIYGILYVHKTTGKALKDIIDSPEVHREGHLYDGDALYAALCRRGGWEEPLPGSREDAGGIMVWSQDYSQIIPVTVPEGYHTGGLYLVWDEHEPEPEQAVILDLNGARPHDPSSDIIQMLFNEIPHEWFSSDAVLELSAYYNGREDQGLNECVCGVELSAASLREILNCIREEISGEYPGFGVLNDDGEWDASFNEEFNTASLYWQENDTDRCFGFDICPTNIDAVRKYFAEHFDNPFSDSLEVPEGLRFTLDGKPRLAFSIRPDTAGPGFLVTIADGAAIHEMNTDDLSVKDLCALDSAVINYRYYGFNH